LSTTFFQLTENGVSEGTLLEFINKQDTTIATEMYAGMLSFKSNTASGVQFLSCSVIKDSGVKAGLIALGNDSNYAVVNISGLDGSLYCSGAVYENGTALSSKYAPLSATQMVPVTPTVGNGSIMALSNNTTHKKLNQVFINCAVTFSGSRASGSLLLRLPMALQRTQYITVNKNGSASYMSSFAAGGSGVADCNCPVAFASGDIAYITGVVTLD
jgi:hypothetical protein